MAEMQPNDTTDNVVAAPPTEVPTMARYRVSENLPKRYVADEYVVHLAKRLDETQDSLDAERGHRREAVDQMLDTLRIAATLEGERNSARAELRGLKAGKWTPKEIAAMAAVVVWAVFVIGFFVVPAIAHVVGA
jgi:hypothetical protein